MSASIDAYKMSAYTAFVSLPESAVLIRGKLLREYVFHLPPSMRAVSNHMLAPNVLVSTVMLGYSGTGGEATAYKTYFTPFRCREHTSTPTPALPRSIEGEQTRAARRIHQKRAYEPWNLQLSC